MTFDYTSRDYAAIREQMIEIVQARIPGWTAAPNDFGTALVEAVSYMGDMFSYYLDRNAQELNILTANQPYNVLALADLFGYSPDLSQSVIAELQITNSAPAIVTLPPLTRVRTPGGMLFEIQEEIAVPAQGSVLVDAWQGTTSEFVIGVSNGKAGQNFSAPDNGTDSRRIEVLVKDGPVTTTWLFVPRIIDAGPEDKVFSVTPDPSTGQIRVIFGDGASGVIPSAGAELVLIYRSCLGDVTVNAGQITYLDVSWDAGVSYASISVTNTKVATGGANPEGIPSIRRNTAASLRTQYRAVVPDDYADQARTVVGVSDAQVVPRLWSRPVVRVLPRAMSDLDPPGSDRLIDAVERHLNSVCIVGVTPSVVTATNILFTTRIDLHLYDNTSQRRVWDEAKLSLEKRFSYAAAAFDRVISASEILVGLSHDCVGIRYANVTDLHRGVEPTNYTQLTPVDGEVFTLNFLDEGASATLNLIGGIPDRSGS